MRSVIGTRRQFANWFDIAAQLVGDDDTRRAEPADQPLEETPCSPGVPPGLYHDVEHVTVRVDGPPRLQSAAQGADGQLAAIGYANQLAAAR